LHSALAAAAALWSGAGLPAAALANLQWAGRPAPVLPSSFRVDDAAQATIAVAALAAGELLRLRTGNRQRVTVDRRHAAVEFRSERHLRVAGTPPSEMWDAIAGLYPTADGWVRLHTNFPHHRAGVLRLLTAIDRDSVAAALLQRAARAFEDEAAEAGLCVTALRSFAVWDAHPQGRAVSDRPVRIERIGDAPAEPLPTMPRPLGGVRVLDLTRIIAGPVAGRTLAAHGADVLAISAAHLPSISALARDTGRGKLSARLDLRDSGDRARLEALAREADVFVQGYRPGALAARGFSDAALAALRPGIVTASLSAYGEAGPWRDRRGFDSLLQTASGFNVAEAEAAGQAAPRPLPAQALDHASGYLLAFGVMVALHRRATVGGSWRVSVSLATTGRWLRGLGRVANGFAAADLRYDDVADLLETTESGFGQMVAVRHAARMADTPAVWARPSVPLGTHEAVWPPRGTM